ncbi:MAG: YciI family protein [Flavitalea sp.]
MIEFLFLFRRENVAHEPQASPQQMQANMKDWQDWLGNIAAQDKLVSAGQKLSPTGKIVGSNKMITDGPYVEVKEAVGGYSLIKASSIEEASEIAKGCPILKVGGSVEVRSIVPM